MRTVHVLGSMGLFAVLLLAGALTNPGPASAQSIVTGAIAGTVTDPANAAVAGAAVTLTNTDTGESRSSRTDAGGTFQFPLLKPGNYTVTVMQQGFQTVTQSVTVTVGQTTTANVKLVLGATEATVEVTGAPPLLQTENANLSTVYDTKQVENIPNPGNDVTYVANFAPGVMMNNSTAGGYGNFSTFGLPANANLFTINGNDYNDPFLNINNTGSSNLLLGNNDIQEFSVVNNAYTVQYGRQAGAQVDYTTKSGTNSFHGDMIYNWTGRDLNANDPINKLEGNPRPFENNNQWAAGLGGPIVKNKLFFWADTEGIRYIFGANSTVVVPTRAFESYVLGNVPQDAATQAFYNNMFSLYNSAPGITKATVNPDSCGTELTGFTGDCTESWGNSTSNGNKEWLLIGRVDYDMGDNDKIFGRVKFDRGTQPTYTDPINPAFDDQSIQPQNEGQLNYTHIFGPNVVNNFIGSVLWYSALFGPLNPSTPLGIFPGNLLFLDGGNVNVGTITPLGTGSGNPNGFSAGYAYPSGRDVTQWGLVDDLSVIRGNHAFKMGFNFRRDDVSDHTAAEQTEYPAIETSMLGFANDQITPIGGATPGTVYSYFTNTPVQPLAIYSFGLYFQDEYRVTPDLKLTMGIRAERNSGGVCQHACAAVPFSPFDSLPHGADVPYDQSFGAGQTNIANVEKVLFEPRLGLAWTPFGKNTVIRTGVGLFSDLYPGQILDLFTTNFPLVNRWVVNPGPASVAFDDLAPGSTAFPTSGPAAVDQCNAAFSSNYSSGGNLPDLIGAYGLLPNPAACFSSTGTPLVPNYNSPPSKILNPKYVEWNFEIEHEFGSRTVVSANYVGNHGYDEMMLDPYLNAFCDLTCSGTGPGEYGLSDTGLPATAPDPRVGSVLGLTNNGYSNYNGLTLSISENGWHGLYGSLNYTYSHALDLVSNGGTNEPFSVITSLNYQLNPFNPNAQYGPADYDARHEISANYIYALPFKSENRMMDAAVGGWQISGDFFWHTGFPFSVIDGATTSAIDSSENMVNAAILLQPVSGFTQRSFPNGTACAQWIVNQPPCFSASDFTLPATNFTGSVVGRNAFRGPGFFGADFSLRKTFKITERSDFQIGLNVYNLFNHSNIGAPWPTTGPPLPLGGSFFTAQPPTSPYGAFAAAATDMRMAQIMGRLDF